MDEKAFNDMIRGLGGRAYIAGGWVRDMVRGAVPKDRDYVVTGVDERRFIELLKVQRVGKAFPVYLVNIDGTNAEVAFARKERKFGSGYKGFRIESGADISIEEDLYRRDTTMNSMAFCLESRQIIDPYGGIAAIEKRCIQATSWHFSEDPVRALRAARQAVQFGFTIVPDTLSFMRDCADELADEPKERIVAELTQALQCKQPSRFFQSLREADLLDIVFPEIYALIGKSQALKYHPEGDAYAHSLIVLDRVATISQRIEVRFAALLHDIGKGLTEKSELPHHYKHEQNGLIVLEAMRRRLPLPRQWASCAEFVIREHMRVMTIKKVAKIVDFLLLLGKSPVGVDGFTAIVQSDNGSVPDILHHYEEAMAVLRAVRGDKAPPSLQGVNIGKWVREQQIIAYRNMFHNE